MSNIDFHKRAAKIMRGGGHLAQEKAVYKLLRPRLRKLDVELSKKVAHGTNADIYFSDDLEKIYGRKGLCLKVFWRSKSMWGYEGAGGISTIQESTIAQNLLALDGICPRVYDLVLVKGDTAQVTDYMKGKSKKKVVKDYRFDFYHDDWDRDHNFIGGKMVDLQGTKLKDYKEYKRCVVSEIIKSTNAHGHGNNLYQSTDYHNGLRETRERIKKYKFENFGGKTVLDIGCSNGMMCRAAYDAGAKRVVGLEWPDMAKYVQQLAILDGYYNIDFYGVDIKKLTKKRLKSVTGIDRFDIHLFFAMEAHVGWPDWVKNCDTLYYEGHGRKRPYKVYNYASK